MMLRPDEVLRFKKHGSLLKSRFLQGDDFIAFERAILEIEGWPEVPGQHMIYRSIPRIENVYPYHAGVRAVIDGPIKEAMTDLFGEPVVLFKDKIHPKPPGAMGFKAHQDQRTYGDYHDYSIAAGIAIDQTTPENGWLEAVAGRHREGLFGEPWDTLPNEAGFDWAPVSMNPGDVLFFDGYTPHRSAPNRSNRKRRMMFLTFNRASDGDHRERHFADKRLAYPPDIEREPGKKYLTGSERRGFKGMQT